MREVMTLFTAQIVVMFSQRTLAHLSPDPTGCAINMRIVWYAHHSSIKGFKHVADF